MPVYGGCVKMRVPLPAPGFTVPVPRSLDSIGRGSRNDAYSCDMPLRTEHSWKGGMTGQATVA